jgi:hypothetical protein
MKTSRVATGYACPRTQEERVASGDDFRRMALSLEGTCEAPHFDRIAFKVARTYATLAPDGLTANLKLDPGEQELKCLTAPDAFEPVRNKWGARGWTTAKLAALGVAELENALALAWRHALPRRRDRCSGSATR